jgi:hypothetical protein
MAWHEHPAKRWHAASPRAEQTEQAGRHRQRSYPVPDPKRAPDAPCIVVHPVIPCPRILR